MVVKGGAVTRVGVAFSGGGHRAWVWAAGLLLYLADAGRNGDVGAIASVSGGSIINGVVAQQMDYRQARANEVRTAWRRASGTTPRSTSGPRPWTSSS